MKKYLVVFLILTVTLISYAEDMKLLTYTVNDRGVGPVKIGMSLSEASSQLGVNIADAPYKYGDEDCFSYAFGLSEMEWDIRFIVVQDKIGKIDIYTDKIRTIKGLGIGSFATEVMKTYEDKYIIQGAHEWPNKNIRVALGNDLFIWFEGPQLAEGEWSYENVPKPKEIIEKLSIGRNDAGSIEGCL